MLKEIILKFYFVFYNVHRRNTASDRGEFWFTALIALSVPVMMGSLSILAIIADIFKVDLQFSRIIVLFIGIAECYCLYKLIFVKYSINKYEDAKQINMSITTQDTVGVWLFYIGSFGILLLRTYLKYGYLVRPE